MIEHTEFDEYNPPKDRIKKTKIVLETTEETLEFEVELLINACNHMIETLDKNVKHYRQYKGMYAEQSNNTTIENTINSHIAMLGHYQNLKSKLEKNLKVAVHS